MVFGVESATGVPRWQRPNFSAVYDRASARAWLLGRTLRGFLTTAALAGPALCLPASAHAQATARFADAPAEPVTSPLAPEPASAAAPPAPPAVEASASVPPLSEPPPAPTPQVSFTRRLAQSHFERGQVLEQRGDIAQALREYTECIGVDQTFGDAYLRLGALREKMGDPREAELVYGQALRLNDTRARALLQRSHLRRAVGLHAEALSDLESVALLDSSSTVLGELARDYVEVQAWSAALAIFRRIAASAADHGDAAALETAHLEVRALRVLAAETDPSQTKPAKHDWVSRALRSIARR